MKKSGSMGYRIVITLINKFDCDIEEEYKTIEPEIHYVKQTLRRIYGMTDTSRYDFLYSVMDIAAGRFIQIEL